MTWRSYFLSLNLFSQLKIGGNNPNLTGVLNEVTGFAPSKWSGSHLHSQYILFNHMALLSAGAVLGTRNMDLKLKTLQRNGYFKGNCMCSKRFKER